MKINIINLDKEGWILTKFAKKMYLHLKLMEYECFLSKKARKDVDINHSIIFLFLKDKQALFPEKTIKPAIIIPVRASIIGVALIITLPILIFFSTRSSMT